MTSLASADARPILIVPYMWIGDFVRCHSVVKVLKSRWPDRPVDLLTTALCRPLADYMPGLRQAILADLPRSRIALVEQRALAQRLRANHYGLALIMPRTWKAALAPFLAGIPHRVGFVGEARFGLLNEWRWGERRLPRMVDRCAMLALPQGAPLPADWPLPELAVPAAEVDAWRERLGIEGRPAVALCPGAVGPSKRWPAATYGEVARTLTARGIGVWVIGGPDEARLAAEIAAAGGPLVRDLTGPDLRNAILALAATRAAVSNDSGLLHVAAALGTPAIGVFGPTSPWHWAPLNPLAAVIETRSELDCRPCHKPTCRLRHHRCMRDIPAAQVLEAVERALAA
ncbi:MAG TPA: lipopolysaccharide heptosyltransferase II [Xanthobacteraceae bacterium]|jgi:heptosyltransferase-2|nr:lipopolysaccharide heptosyltransferase II [Xanthobacteraceae bacterium]